MCGGNKPYKMASIKVETGQTWNQRWATWIKPSEQTGSADDFNIYLLNKIECPGANCSHGHWPLINITVYWKHNSKQNGIEVKNKNRSWFLKKTEISLFSILTYLVKQPKCKRYQRSTLLHVWLSLKQPSLWGYFSMPTESYSPTQLRSFPRLIL